MFLALLIKAPKQKQFKYPSTVDYLNCHIHTMVVTFDNVYMCGIHVFI